jgi:hypothetical protein
MYPTLNFKNKPIIFEGVTLRTKGMESVQISLL